MEFLSNAWEGLKNAFSSMGSGISNMFSGASNWFSGLGGGSGSGVSGAIGATTLAAGMAVTPAPTATPGFVPQQPSPVSQAYPSPVTNMHNTSSLPNQVLGQLNGAATQALSRMGTLGQVLSPMVDANMRVIDMNMRANQNGAISCAPPGQPMGPTPNLRGAFGGSCGAYEARMEAAREAGSRAMIERGTNQSIQILGQRGLNGIYTPQGNGGVVGDAISRIFRR